MQTLDFLRSSSVASSLKEDAAILGRNVDFFTEEIQNRRTSHPQPQMPMWTKSQTPEIQVRLPQHLSAVLVATFCQVTAPWKTNVASGIRQSYCQRMISLEVVVIAGLCSGC